MGEKGWLAAQLKLSPAERFSNLQPCVRVEKVEPKSHVFVRLKAQASNAEQRLNKAAADLI